MPSLTTSPWQAAIDRLDQKTPVGSALRSKEWAEMPLALRERAQFSAGVTQVQTMAAVQEKLRQGLTQERPGGTGMDRGRFVADLRALVGAAPGDSGKLTDFTSVRRLELVWNFQMADAHGFAARKADLDPNLLDAFPAYRLVRVESRRVPRDWYAAWGRAGAAVGWEGASQRVMVALKTAKIWTGISRFGRPWPPFDYASGMGLEDVDRDEAEALGLLPKGEAPADRLQRLRDGVAAGEREWNKDLSAGIKNLSEEARGWLQKTFGKQIEIGPDRVEWKGGRTQDVEERKTWKTPEEREAVSVVTENTLPDTQKVTDAVAKAATREDAHAILALPEAARGTLSLNPTPKVAAQTQKAGEFLRSVLHKDVAPAASCKVQTAPGGQRARGCYRRSIATAFVRSGSVENAVHELGHHIEITNPRILAECKAFLQSRTKPGEQPQRLSKLTGDRRYKDREIAIEDEWVARGGHVYTGRVYRTIATADATEILTMGLQRLYEDPIAFAAKDPTYFKFILSVLRP